MSLGVRLYALMSADPGISGLVGTKIHPIVAPEGEAPPFIVYTVALNAPLFTFDGSDAMRKALIQISTFARHYADVHAVADAIEAFLATRSGAGLSIGDGPIFTSEPKRRDLSAEVQPQWYHVAIDVNAMTLDT